MNLGVRSQVVDVPMRPRGQLLVVGNPGTQAAKPQRAPQVDIIPGLQSHCSVAPNLNAEIGRTGEDQRVCPGYWLKTHLAESPELLQRLPTFLRLHYGRLIPQHQQVMVIFRVEILAGSRCPNPRGLQMLGVMHINSQLIYHEYVAVNQGDGSQSRQNAPGLTLLSRTGNDSPQIRGPPKRLLRGNSTIIYISLWGFTQGWRVIRHITH